MSSTWSVRIPDDLKEKICGMIAESGLDPKDFVSRIVQAYELKAAKKLQPLVEADIEELSLLTGRVHNLFINLCERVTNFQQQREQEFEKKLSEKDEMFSVFNDKLRVKEEELLQCEDDAATVKKQYNEVCRRYAQTAETCEAHKALVVEYREKNDTLTGLLGEYKEFKVMVEALKRELEEEKSLHLATESKLQQRDMEIEQIKGEMEEVGKAAERHLQQRLEIASIEKDREILSLQMECQRKLEELQQQYVEKAKGLLEVIEALQKPQPANSRSLPVDTNSV